LKIRHHLLPISIIEKFNVTDYGVLNKPNLSIHNVKAKMERYSKGFSISWPDDHINFRSKKFALGNILKSIQIRFKGFNLNFKDLYIRAHHSDSTYGSIISATCGYFNTVGFRRSRPYYYRLIVPLEIKFNFHFQIQSSNFSNDLDRNSTLGTAGTINEDTLQVCLVDHDEKHYLIVESAIKQPFSSFSDKAYAVKNAIGYLTGHLAGNAGFYFAYSNAALQEPVHFYFNEWRNTIISSYHPINANPFAYHKNKSTFKFFNKNLLRALTLEEFSSICQKLYDSEQFTAIVILILESSIASLVLMPGAFAIALESMAELLTDPIKEKIAPIKNRSLAKKIRSVCSEIIKKECIELPLEDLNTLLGRVERINEVTNKSRLRIPFKLLNIELSVADLDTIETRNAFLHGRIPDITGVGDKRSEKREGLDRYYASLRLYTLLNRLILKWCGYNNYIMNHAKIQEKATIIRLKEPYYLKD